MDVLDAQAQQGRQSNDGLLPAPGDGVHRGLPEAPRQGTKAERAWDMKYQMIQIEEELFEDC